ncbi:hypothetical protein [Persicobacter sp. CCB-QB2]|uniref:hypothetical protein n=1 Tax=Persicobacter sp. CCB-QB2 TaxID=1561025 RepID=UPI0006A97C55|nr:hypothetical protein [Persicobacter sp. CCB-QB2]
MNGIIVKPLTYLKNITILLILTLLCTNLKAQEKAIVNLFKTTDDYISNTYTDTNVTILIKEMGENHIWVKKFIDDKTGKKIKKANYSWAIEYNGNNYFNLGYSHDLNNWNVFIKFNSEGEKYCMSFIDNNSAGVIKNSGINYGGGLQGVLMKDSDKWGKYWRNNNEEKIKILFIDLTNQMEANTGRNKGSLGNLLKRNELKTKFGLEKTYAEIKNLTFEEVLAIIERNNK